MNLEQLIAEIVANSGVTDPEVQELIAKVSTDSAALALRALAGENVEKELGHVRAQALNLSVYIRRQIEAMLTARVTNALVRALATVA